MVLKLEVLKFTKAQISYLKLATEFLNINIMFVSKCQYGLAAMMYHVKPIYVMTHQYINISWHPYLVHMQPHTYMVVSLLCGTRGCGLIPTQPGMWLVHLRLNSFGCLVDIIM